jgi:hypothetical protein
MAQLLIVMIVIALIYWLVTAVVVVTAIVTLLAAGLVGFATYHLLGLSDMESNTRLGIAMAVGGVTTAAYLYYTYGGWGLVFAIVCVGIVLAKLNG